MNPLDIKTFPLNGSSLIEASAGTGKTYTIVNLYLRLLLGHGCAPLGVEQILLVTFTNAATAELKERIRNRIRSAYLDFYRGQSDDPLTNQLIQDSADREKDSQRLLLASKQMDEAAIYTIHSFCQRMLSEHAFESGVTFDETFELDESQWILDATMDYWRKNITGLELNLLTQVLDFWATPEQLMGELKPFLHRQFQVLAPITILQGKEDFYQYLNALEDVKQWWLNEQIGQRLIDLKLRANARLGKASTIAAMDSFCCSNRLVLPMDKGSFSAWTQAALEKAKTNKSGDVSQLDFSPFEQLEKMRVATNERLKQAFLYDALVQVESTLEGFKRRLNVVAPDDLLSRLRDALQREHGSELAQAIVQRHPAALIDEFQDTDPIQFEVFQRVYAKPTVNLNPCWIMIGDPKQAIYGFRGADVFTYISAKRSIDTQRHFTLSTNWRSTPQLVNAVNTLFQSSKEGFLYQQDIPFQPVGAANGVSQVHLDDVNLASLSFHHLHSGDQCLPANSALPALAEHFAAHIAALLERGNVTCESDGGSVQRVNAGDCCVLVRNRIEAAHVKTALAAVNVASVFLVRHSVFETVVAQDLYRLLAALCEPHNERLLKAALASELLCLDGQELEQLFSDEMAWQITVEQFVNWQKNWQERGIMLTLSRVMQHYNVYERTLNFTQDGLRQLTDLRHLMELLQHQSAEKPGLHQLLAWLAEHLSQPDHNNEAQQLRLETDDSLVQIVTMHGSKGLEFPLVFIPFACTSKSAKQAIFHQEDGGTWVDFSNRESSMTAADYERLAEDIRLFYVALTRAQIYCCVGIWNPRDGRANQSALPSTPLGKLLMCDQPLVDDDALAESLIKLQNGADIAYLPLSQGITQLNLNDRLVPQKPDWQVAQLQRTVSRNWQLTSYSAIARDQANPEWEQPGTDEPHIVESATQTEQQESNRLDRFTFVKGAQAGSFLHGVLEEIQFAQPNNLAQVIETKGQWYAIEPFWNTVVETWILDLLQSPFASSGVFSDLYLGQLRPEQCVVEMEFHLPLKQVKGSEFNRIVNLGRSTVERQYGFESLNGMLKGFIDLTFEYQGQYFVADYKSNFLGDSIDAYEPNKLQRAMDEHDYGLQAILYTLALHRFLKLNLANYDYQKHIGGAFYLFLRGMSKASPGNGCYFVKPEQTLIDALDRLFDGEPVKIASQDMEQLKLC